MVCRATKTLLCAVLASFIGSGFSFVLTTTRNTSPRRHTLHATHKPTDNGTRANTHTHDRRRALSAAFAALCLTTPIFGNTPTASAANTYVAGTVWLTGKQPQIPGQKPRDKNDLKGTRKDSNFLRSISDCKSQCERTSDSDGLAKPKEDCLSECQDICCDSYEQCTFAIVPRL